MVYTHTHTHTHTHTVEYYSAIKKNEILPFATAWMELEGIRLREIRERQKSYDFTQMRTLRNKTDEHKGRDTKIIYKRRGTKHKRLKYGEQTEGYWRGRGRRDGLNG